MEDFSITTQVRPMDYVKVAYHRLYRRPAVILCCLFGLVMLYESIWGEARISFFYPVPPALGILLGFLFVLYPTLIVLANWKRLLPSSRFGQEIIYSFSEDGYTATVAMKTVGQPWHRVIMQAEVGRWLIIYYTEKEVSLVDKRKLTDVQLQFIRSKIAYR